MGFFDFFKSRIDDTAEIDKTMNELHVLLQKKEVQDALIQSETFGTVGIGQMTYLKQVNTLIYKLSKLTGKTPEEIFSDPANLTSKKEMTLSLEDEQYLDALIIWANKHNLPELKIEDHMTIAGGYHSGIPKDKKKLFNLHTLNLSNCNLSELPKEVGKLKNLKKLWLDGNNLTYLPNEICNLFNLEELYIPNNKIEKLPEDIGNLRQLVEINFNNNNLRFLPVSMILLKNLQKIDFRNQKHGNKVLTPVIADLICSNAYDDNVPFRKEILMLDDDNWNNLKKQLRTVTLTDVKIVINGEEILFLNLIEKVYGKSIAKAQINNHQLFFDLLN